MSDVRLENLSAELKRLTADLNTRVSSLEGPLQIDEMRRLIVEYDDKIQAPDFWDTPEAAQKIQKERTHCAQQIEDFDIAQKTLADCGELIEMAEGDEETLREVEKEIAALDERITKMEFARMLSGPQDRNNAILSVNVGQGGVDASDFTEMLLRMYTRYAQRKGFGVEELDLQPAEEAGIKGATILVKGEYAYGYLKAEIGVHRLVRISPFDANARRQTSFASVWVLPEIDDDIDIDIRPDDLKTETMRAGGAGGQHVNKTESAVRITHLPTGTVVLCRQERSQVKNRATAMKILRAKLFELEMKKRMVEKDAAEAQKMEASFGSQIRNYVLAPYRLAKDLRSGYETGNVDAVLDGELQDFIEAYLLKKSEETLST